MANRRICLVCDGYWDQLQGGAEYQLFLMANELSKIGHAVSYVYVDRGTPVRETAFDLVPVTLSPWIKLVFYPYHPFLKQALTRELRRINPDIVINRVGNAITGICAAYCRRFGKTMLWHIANETDIVPPRAKWNRTFFMTCADRAFLRYGIRHADYIVAQAKYQDHLLKRVYGRPADLVLPNFHPTPTSLVEKSPPIKVVWVSNIKPRKKPEAFLDLVRRFAHRPDVQFIMVGRMDGSSAYRRKMDDMLGRQKNLEYTGELSIGEVNKILSQAHVLVNTSQYEGFPNTYIQAWMRELPVVSLHVDPDGVIERHRLGYHSRSPARLIADVKVLIEDDEQRTAMGRRAREYALNKHSLKPNVATFSDFIECL